MKPILAFATLIVLSACVAPDVPVDRAAFGSDALADSACRTAAAKQGLTVRSITAFREVTGSGGPSGMSGIMTVGGGSSGEARCDFSYATGKATISVY
jgi:ABC-type uncharacterized transport system permease subunit